MIFVPSRLRAAILVAFIVGMVACKPTGIDSLPSPTPTVSVAATSTSVVPTANPSPSTAPPSATPTVVASPTAVSSTPVPATSTKSPVTERPLSIPTPPPRDLIDLERRLKTSATPVAQPTTQRSPDYGVGSEQTFWVANQISKSYFQARARIVYKTAHAYWYVQDGVNLPAADVKSAADYFENRTYAVEHQLFGSEWTPGIDNDVHITILVGNIPGVGGYYSTADEYTTAVNPFSNQREMIYINVDAVRPGAPGFNATVAHEFMHMIQFHVHRWQNSWVDEGSAELAAQAVTGSASGAVRAFAAMPDTQLDAWASDPTEAIPHYGAAYLFMRYVAEQYGGFAAIGKIIAEPARGIDSFEQFFHTMNPSRSFEDVFADWVAANALDDPTLDSGRYGYQSLHLAITVHDGPPVGGQVTGQVHQFGATYYRIQVDRPATLIFTE